ncbi:YqaE/Pmp3 family membrane protein [Fulvivirga sp. 29W222]|uniref:YqaE/Pmp3 family membrane protein n=2 Tax=Fulvivirga marina TaxID=2494733 RepID=A0A937KAZ4_9BACT|nr:YqaE/Pmp3 family membrane protein [Fulvivirga marina]
MIILAVLIPPLAVGLTYGVIDKFWISLILTILFFIPGMVYSLIVVHDYFR